MAAQQEMADFIQMIADMTPDQECIECGSDEDVNPKCVNHELWDMPNDVAAATLNDIIRQARDFFPRRPSASQVPCHQGGDWHNRDVHGVCTDCTH